MRRQGERRSNLGNVPHIVLPGHIAALRMLRATATGTPHKVKSNGIVSVVREVRVEIMELKFSQRSSPEGLITN